MQLVLPDMWPIRCHHPGGSIFVRFRWFEIECLVLRDNNILGEIVRTARPKHERINAHSDVLALRFDAFPYEHTGALIGIYRAGFGADFVVVTAAWHRFG